MLRFAQHDKRRTEQLLAVILSRNAVETKNPTYPTTNQEMLHYIQHDILVYFSNRLEQFTGQWTDHSLHFHVQ